MTHEQTEGDLLLLLLAQLITSSAIAVGVKAVSASLHQLPFSPQCHMPRASNAASAYIKLEQLLEIIAKPVYKPKTKATKSVLGA